MRCTNVVADYWYRKAKYTVIATRIPDNQEVDISIYQGDELLQASRVRCTHAFGTGVCSRALEDYLAPQRKKSSRSPLTGTPIPLKLYSC